MFKTCIYCNRNLGQNETVENFPVGRRLAFDQRNGRLWVVCERCRRWNLSPLEERWEAIEECERQFRDTRLRFSTDNIGLARLREGLDLVRIGRPLRPEYAAWRYGREFYRRRVRGVLKATARGFGYTLSSFLGLFFFFVTDDNSRVIARVRDGEGVRLPIVRKDLKELQLQAGAAPGAWSLTVPYRERERIWLFGKRGRGVRRTVELQGGTALRAAGRILPWLNPFGGKSTDVENAVKLIEEVGDPERVFAVAPEVTGFSRLTRMDVETRLALEMAAHEETERRAMEGELAELEAAWREAEEIAAIADTLLLPKDVDEWLEEERKGGRER
jgi:hypothetical protein